MDNTLKESHTTHIKTRNATGPVPRDMNIHRNNSSSNSIGSNSILKRHNIIIPIRITIKALIRIILTPVETLLRSMELNRPKPIKPLIPNPNNNIPILTSLSHNSNRPKITTTIR